MLVKHFFNLSGRAMLCVLLACGLALPALAQQPMHALAGRLQVRLNHYDTAHYNRLANTAVQALDAEAHSLSLLGSEWRVAQQINPLPGKANGVECRVVFRCVQGRLPSGSVSVEMVFDQWSVNNYVLLPSSAYNGNRYQWRRLRYSPKLYEVQDIGPDKPIILTDVPKLNEADGPSRIQERSGALAMPAMGFQSPGLQQGFWLLAEQGNALGDYGMNVEESRDRRQASFSLTAPIVREQFMYVGCDNHWPSSDRPKDFVAGDSVVFRFRLHAFQATSIQHLYDQYFALRKSFNPASLVNSVPFSDCFLVEEEKYNRENWVATHGYYSIGLRNNYMQDWQIGWTGGMLFTHALLFAGQDSTRQRVLRNFDWLFPAGIAPSGFYWDAGRNGTEWIGGDLRKPHTHHWHLVRKSGDGVFSVIKQFMLMQKMGIAVKPAWANGNETVCKALVKLWKKNGQLGQYVHSLTGEIVVGGSSAGAIVPAALALAAHFYNQPAYLETAEQIGEYYYTNFTRKGISCGAVADALQNFDAESSYALVESFVTLYEATGKQAWLHKAEEAARQFSSWVISYDYQFPANTAFGQLNVRTTGAVYANTQNKHATPGICTGSGIALLKLYRYTDNRDYADLLQDIAKNLPQYLPHLLKPFGHAKMGYISERVNLTDWETGTPIGGLLPLSTFAESSLMLTTIEVPGIYLQPQKNSFLVFDNVEAKLVKATATTMTLAVTNPTKMRAEVKVLSAMYEPSKMMGENALYGAPLLRLAPGETKTIQIEKSTGIWK